MDEINANTKKIVCIDDDRTMLMVVKQMLAKSYGPEDLEVLEASDGEEGLKVIEESNPDIVLCDIDMPGISGLELCAKLRADNSRATIILMSAYEEEEDNAAKAKETGADAYLAKPVKKGELTFLVNSVLKVGQLNDILQDKKQQLENSLAENKKYQDQHSEFGEELQGERGRLSNQLKEMMDLNTKLEAKNEEIFRMHDELAKRFDSTVGLLTNIIDVHQSAHRGHSQRVAEISEFVAKKMGLSDYQAQNIKIAGALHELGIVCLPPKEKVEDLLDEGESRKLTHHPLVGEMLLKGFPGFEPVADIIRHLHENIDGSGIPDKLAGDQIPIGSRIVSASSFLDHVSLTDSKLTPSEIMGIIEKEGGVLFDEDVLIHLKEYVFMQSATEEEKTVECPVFSLEAGMELASDIYSQSGVNLLKRGTVLDKELLARVLKFHSVDPLSGTVKIKKA